MKRILLIIPLLSFSLLTMGQGQITRKNPIPPKGKRESNMNQTPSIQSPKFNWDSCGICQDSIIDLGLSVKWAGWNIGASTPEQEGTLFGWGDPTGKETSIYSSKYPVKDPPMSICGDRRYDMAMANWGWPWRLPSRNELEELSSKCTWEYISYKGVNGFKLTGPNGNTLFLPITSYRTTVWDNDKKGYKEKMEIHRGTTAHYYSGELNSNGGQWEPWDCRPYVLCGLTNQAHGYVDGGGLRSTGYPVRAVYAK